jgi:flavin reductase (DIM6/NTAB) family NADH-FMN oxidoreductase RutF
MTPAFFCLERMKRPQQKSVVEGGLLNGHIEARLFRDALGCFATGITIVTGRGPSGELLGLTANSFNAVSLAPSLVLFSLHREAHSLTGFETSGHFAINVLSSGQTALSRRFARARADKWAGVDFEEWDTGCPILKGALANLECKTHAIYDGGDHAIFVGRVLRLRAELEGKPLVYFRGAYCGLDISK